MEKWNTLTNCQITSNTEQNTVIYRFPEGDYLNPNYTFAVKNQEMQRKKPCINGKYVG